MVPANLFHGSAVHLRRFESEDAPALYAYLTHPDLIGRRYIPWQFSWDVPLSRGQVEGIIQKWTDVEKELPLAVVHNETDAIVGHAGASWRWDPHSPDIYLAIDPAHWRKGYGSDALNLLFAYLFESTIAHNVSGSFGEWNGEARAFAAYHGFTEAGRFRRAGMRDGATYDEILVDILRPEWEAREDQADAAGG